MLYSRIYLKQHPSNIINKKGPMAIVLTIIWYHGVQHASLTSTSRPTRHGVQPVTQTSTSRYPSLIPWSTTYLTYEHIQTHPSWSVTYHADEHIQAAHIAEGNLPRRQAHPDPPVMKCNLSYRRARLDVYHLCRGVQHASQMSTSRPTSHGVQPVT